MLTQGDDYPLHQTAEPMAYSGTDRNFYDRYFFNGYSPDGSVFFAAALGVYPQLDIMDAAFCLSIDGVQHNIRASKRMNGERLNMQVGPITLLIEKPLHQIRVRIASNDSPIVADLLFEVRHAPVQEPRFTWRKGPRLLMDYTRMTQNGAWRGTITLKGQDIAVTPDQYWGTRDRSWGIRSVGAPESQPPPDGNFPQFYWIWMPFNFENHASFFHSNEDGEGLPWNRRGVVDDFGNKQTGAMDYDGAHQRLSYVAGSRLVKDVSVDYGADALKLAVTPTSRIFYMSGLGYMHPKWGHGMDHGPLDTAYDSIDLANVPAHDMLYLHVQAFAAAQLSSAGQSFAGRGVVEQMFIGPHAPSGLSGLLDPA